MKPSDQAAMTQFALLLLFALGVVPCWLVAKRHGVAKRGRWGALGFFLPFAFHCGWLSERF